MVACQQLSQTEQRLWHYLKIREVWGWQYFSAANNPRSTWLPRVSSISAPKVEPPQEFRNHGVFVLFL